MDQSKIDLIKALELVGIAQAKLREGKGARSLPVVELGVDHVIQEKIRSFWAPGHIIRCRRTAHVVIVATTLMLGTVETDPSQLCPEVA